MQLTTSSRARSLPLIANVSMTTSFEVIVWGHFYLRLKGTFLSAHYRVAGLLSCNRPGAKIL